MPSFACGYVASAFVEPEIKQEDDDIRQLIREVRALREPVQTFERRAAGGSTDGS